jgi:5-hydroxyisourate hydrolase
MSEHADRDAFESDSMGRLTTHVLDTSAGRPAAGLKLVLSRLGPRAGVVREAVTNGDGRVDGPLMEGADFVPGTYELAFHVGDYFRARQGALADPPFLDVVPVRFGLSGDSHYHVPLLISPYGYSTYRGS